MIGLLKSVLLSIRAAISLLVFSTHMGIQYGKIRLTTFSILATIYTSTAMGIMAGATALAEFPFRIVKYTLCTIIASGMPRIARTWTSC